MPAIALTFRRLSRRRYATASELPSKAMQRVSCSKTPKEGFLDDLGMFLDVFLRYQKGAEVDVVFLVSMAF